MAELTEPASAPEAWTSAQTRTQLATVAWLRWRIFVNAFRAQNKKRRVAGWIVYVLLRLIGFSVIGVFFVGPILGSGFWAYYAIAHHHPGQLSTLTWIVLSIGFFISINVSPTTLGFDLTPLLRFPIGFRSYLLVRLFFGLFSIPTVIANLSLAGAAVGIGIADHALFPWAALVLGLFALHNVFFLRMVLAWIDRWMSTRRAREIMGAVILFLSLGIQVVAYSGNMAHRKAFFSHAMGLFAPLHPVTQYLPPSLAADSIVNYNGGAFLASFANLAGLAAFALLCLGIFALRLQREFHGENLSEASARAPRQTARITKPGAPSIAASSQWVGSSGNARLAGSPNRVLPSTISACLTKELIYLKRSGAQLYGLITPMVLVYIFSRRNSLFGNTSMLLPYAVAYTLFGLLANLYNVLGADGAGFNLYLLAPIRLRDVILTKNLVSSTVIVAEILIACVVVSFIGGAAPPAAMLTATLSWAAFALLTNLAVGNLRSLLAPMYYVPGKMRRPATKKGTGWISLAVLLGTLIAGLPTIYFCRKYDTLWLATPVFLLLAAAAFAAYLIVLDRIDRIALNHRDGLIEALCRT